MLVMMMIAIYIYISLFSALEQTHCAVVVCDSKRVTVALV